MNECKYSKDKVVDGRIHEICTNTEMKKNNHSEDIHCMGKICGMFEKIDTNNDFMESK